MVRRLIQPRLAKHEFQDTFLDRQHGAFGRTPFLETLGVWGDWVTFASATPLLASDSTLAADVAALAKLQLGNCAYGASTYPLRPFTVPFEGSARPTGAEVLAALRVRNFGSDSIRNLHTALLPAPASRVDTRKDEIHTDPREQTLFTRDDHEKRYGEPPDEQGLASRRAHQALQAEVEGSLYYVRLHEDDGQACNLVVLFAVGKSKRGNRLVGVATMQACHNLCH